MTTRELIQRQMIELGKTRRDLVNEIQCDDKTLSNYINGKTTGGQYLTSLLQALEISPEEWNNCTNVKARKQK